MKKILFLLISLSLPGLITPGWAQKTISGTVRDAESAITLPAANIVIQQAYRGTITNGEGRYTLTIPDSLLPAILEVRYIGYQSQTLRIDAQSSATQDIALPPSVTEMQELVVTDQNPGMRIMAGVIERKQQWRAKLKTYSAQAYTRQNVSNDTALVLVNESASSIFWSDARGAREVIKWRKQTRNIPVDQNFAGVRYLPNFYDDNIDIGGFDVYGITHPEALANYRFELVDQLSMDGRRVYKIAVTPAKNLQPLFKGQAYVLAADSALLEVQLEPNSVVNFPPPVQQSSFAYSQQFNNFGSNFWVPVDVRVTGSLSIGIPGLRFPELNVRQLSHITDYRFNMPLSDTLFTGSSAPAVRVDTAAARTDSLQAIIESQRVPLSRQEQQAYATLDSAQTLSKSFQPSGFLSRFVDFSVSSSEAENRDDGRGDVSAPSSGLGLQSNLSPLLRYNRVDALFAGLKGELNPVDDLQLSANGGYSTGYNEWSYGGRAALQLSEGKLRTTASIRYQAETAPRYQSQILRPLYTSIPNLLGFQDYYDYFRNEGATVSMQFTHSPTSMSLKMAYNSYDQQSLETETGYDLLGRNRTPRINPAIDNGRLNSLSFTAGYNINEGYNFGVIGRRRMAVEVEHGSEFLGSDFDFTRYQAHFDWRFSTFYKRRLLPNTLNISADVGTFSGRLPYQKFGIVDGTPGIISLFEGLRTRRFLPYEGEQFAALNMEHNFRTVPFERLGLTPLVERNIGVILFGGVAKSWVSDQRTQEIVRQTGRLPYTTDGTHVEAGLSLNGLLDLFRFDVATRLDEPGIFVGIGLTRFL